MKLCTSIIFFLVVSCSGLCVWNNVLSSSLKREQAEKVQLLQDISRRDSIISILEKTRHADNEATVNSLRKMELLHDLDTKTASTIASLPTLDCEQTKQQEQAIHQKHVVFDIDMPLPSLSAPLVLLYEKLSTEGSTNATNVVIRNKALASPTSKADDRTAIGTMDTRVTGSRR